MLEWFFGIGAASMILATMVNISSEYSMRKEHASTQKVIPMKDPVKESKMDVVELSRLQNLNRFYQCRSCERYTRQHMMALKSLKDYLELGIEQADHSCPNCGEKRLQIAKEDKKWMATHRHCFRLTEDQYPEYQQTVDEVKEKIEQVKELKSFEEYERKHLTNGPRDSKESEEYFLGEKADTRNTIDSKIEIALAKRYYNEPEDAADKLQGLDVMTKAWREMGVDLEDYVEIQLKEFKERKEFQDYISGGQFLRDGKDPSETVYFNARHNNDTLITSRKHFEENKIAQGWTEILQKEARPSNEFREKELELIEVYTGREIKIMTKKDYDNMKFKAGWQAMDPRKR